MRWCKLKKLAKQLRHCSGCGNRLSQRHTKCHRLVIASTSPTQLLFSLSTFLYLMQLLSGLNEDLNRLMKKVENREYVFVLLSNFTVVILLSHILS